MTIITKNNNSERGWPGRSRLGSDASFKFGRLPWSSRLLLRLGQPRSRVAGVCAMLIAICITAPLLAQDTTADDAATASNDTNSPAVVVEDLDSGSGPMRVEVEGRRVPIVYRKDVLVKSNETADTVVVIGGSAKIHGKVQKDVVVIGGDVELDGEARDVVAVLGGIKLGPGAKVHRDVVAVGGALEIAENAHVHRKPFELDLGGIGIGMRQWVLHGLFKLRPFAPQVGWLWLVAFFFFLIYLIIALVMPGSVRACADELTRRPATTFFMGVLTMMLVPFIFVILFATGIGTIIVPFILAALAFGGFMGKAALFEALGFGMGKRFGVAVLQNPLLAFVAGVVAITALYMVPVLGFLALFVVSLWGLGGAVTAAVGSLRRESPEKPVLAAVGPDVAGSSGPGVAASVGGAPATEPSVLASAPSAPSANVPEALTQRRANFWERMGAGFLDCVIVGILGGLVHGPPWAFLVALAYFAGMWAWKGTTLGGVVLGLKVVRLDGQAVTFVVALVRALACVMSMVVFFLGFLWIGWDREKQAWHDKIAGTVVLRLPRSVPLVCL